MYACVYVCVSNGERDFASFGPPVNALAANLYICPSLTLSHSHSHTHKPFSFLPPSISTTEDAEKGEAIFGTLDSWLIYKLTKGTTHITDVTNASRTLLMNLETLAWDDGILKILNIPKAMLPEIKRCVCMCVCAHVGEGREILMSDRLININTLSQPHTRTHSSSEVYARASVDVLKDVRLAGMLGDQQSALFGQTCYQAGQAKSTYGTGAFLLMNTGTQGDVYVFMCMCMRGILGLSHTHSHTHTHTHTHTHKTGNTIVPSTRGLLTTVAFKLGNHQPVYALEGSVAYCGSLIQWLRDNLGIITSTAESEALAAQVNDSGGIFFVPAFGGMYVCMYAYA